MRDCIYSAVSLKPAEMAEIHASFRENSTEQDQRLRDAGENSEVDWEAWLRASDALDFGPYRRSKPRALKAPAGHIVYFVGGEEGPVKIGFTQQPIKERLKCIQNGSPVKLHVLATQAAPRVKERFYHKQFAAFRLYGEWFERAPEIQAVIDRLNRDD